MDAQTHQVAFVRQAQKDGTLSRLRLIHHHEPAATPDIATATREGVALDDFNALAEENQWPVLIDSQCRFSERKLIAAHDLWQQKAAGGLPRRQDMTARLLQPFIPQLTIYERVSGTDGTLRYRVRLMGTNTVQFTAEMTGRFVDEMIDPEHLPRWFVLGQTILRQNAPLRVLYRGDSFHKRHVVGEVFAAPMLSIDGRADLIMAITTFEGADSWEVVCQRAREQLASDAHGAPPPDFPFWDKV